MWVMEKGREPSFADLVDPATAALIVIDVQNDFLHPDGAFGRMGRDNSEMPAYAARVRGLLEAARAQKIFTVFVRAIYDEYVTPPALAHNRARRGLVDGLCFEGTWGAGWYEGVAPAGLPQEVVLTKHRFDAFHGTPLDLYLRANGIKSVIVAGTATSGCVESTVRDAFFQDYFVVVAEDGVIESVPENHANALNVMARSFGKVVPIQTILDAWRSRNAPARPPGWTTEAKQAAAAAIPGAGALVLAAVQESRRAALTAVLPALETLVVEARSAGRPIIHLRAAAAPAAISPAMLDRAMACGDDPFLPGFVPAEGDWVVDCHRGSGFTESRLGLLLRTNGIGTICIAGAEAFGMLDATVRDGIDRDYRVLLVEETVGFEPEDAGGRATWKRAMQKAGAGFATAAGLFRP